MKRLLAILALIATASLTSAPARASGVSVFEASAQQKQKARQSYKEGRAAIRSKQYKLALQHFRTSYNVVASPNSRMYIVVALQSLGRLSEAYWEAIETVKGAKQAAAINTKYSKAQAKAEESLRAIEKSNAILELKVKSKSTAGGVFVNEKKIVKANWERPHVIAPGMISIRFGNRPALKLNTRAGQRYPVELNDERTVSAPPGSKASPDSDGNSPKTTPGKLLWPGIIVAGAGGLSLVFAAAFGGVAQGIHSDLEASCPSGSCGPEFQAKIDRGANFQTASNVSLTLGLLAAAAGGTLIAFDLWQPQSDKDSSKRTQRVAGRTRLRVGVNHIELGVTF